MTICRFFQQGTCRFGNQCRYEHVYANNHSYGGSYPGGGGGNFGGYRSGGGAGYGNNYNYGNSYGSGGGGGGSGGGNDRGGTSVLRAKAGTHFQQTSGSIFGQPISNTTAYQAAGFFSPNVADLKPAPMQRDVKEILQMIINEFTVWEHSRQWPLSCFSLFKEQGCFPGLIDYSPEEIRWYMYQARAMGNLEECQQMIKGIYDKAKLVKEQLMTPNAEVFEILSRFSRGEKMETPAAPSIPDKPAPSASIFGNTSGGNVQPTTQVAAPFTFTLPNKSLPTANVQNFSAFGTPQENVFPSTFANPIFNNNTPNPSPGIFGGASQMPQVSQTFNAPPVGNGFLSTNSNIQNVNNSFIYTPMEEMTEEMMNAFNAPVYAMGSVPTKPPPKELCGLRS